MAFRIFALGFATALVLTVGVIACVYLSSPRAADAAPKAEAKPLRAGYVSVSELKKEYEKWQEKAKSMEGKRQSASDDLKRQRDLLLATIKKREKAEPEDRPRFEEELRKIRHELDHSEAKACSELDKESAIILRELHSEIVAVIEALADERGLDVVYGVPGHPRRMFEQIQGGEGSVLELQLGSKALTPIFLRNEVDLTAEVVKRLNARADREKK